MLSYLHEQMRLVQDTSAYELQTKALHRKKKKISNMILACIQTWYSMASLTMAYFTALELINYQ